MIYTANEDSIRRAAEAIRAGRLVAFPTETVYGLGADATNAEAVQKIFNIKGRPARNPLIVHLAAAEAVSQVARIDSPLLRSRLEKVARFWPGPLSVVLPRQAAIPPLVAAGLDSIAVRVPDNDVALRLIAAAQVPIAAPSANRSSYISPTAAAHVEEEFGGELEMIIDGGPCSVGVESTVLSLIDETPTLLRPGAITLDTLRQTLGEEVRRSLPGHQAHAPVQSPGLLGRHYAPRTPTIVQGALPVERYPARVGYVSFHDAAQHRDMGYETIITLSVNGDLEQIAQRLFWALRELDKVGLDLIVVDRCGEEGLGEAIMDRLRRASEGG